MPYWHWYGHWWLASSIIAALCWPVYQAHWSEDCSQYSVQLHDLCTQPGDQSAWRHCSVNSTGYGFRSEFSFVCASWLTAAFMAAHHHSSLRHCIWRPTWNHVVACGPGLHRALWYRHHDELHCVTGHSPWLRHELGTHYRHPSDLCRHIWHSGAIWSRCCSMPLFKTAEPVFSCCCCCCIADIWPIPYAYLRQRLVYSAPATFCVIVSL